MKSRLTKRQKIHDLLFRSKFIEKIAIFPYQVTHFHHSQTGSSVVSKRSARTYTASPGPIRAYPAGPQRSLAGANGRPSATYSKGRTAGTDDR
jgi:hypothetical protein